MDIIEPKPHTGTESVALDQALDVGSTLRRGRERLGMSVHDIAERIKFAPRQVEALEANDFAHLPQSTFLRGFVRSYARVLQLDEAALIAALPDGKPRRAVGGTQPVNVSFPTGAQQRINLFWLAGALGIGLVLVLFVVLHRDDQVEKPGVAVIEPVQLPAADVAASAVANSQVNEVKPVEAKPVMDAKPAKAPPAPPVKVEDAAKNTESAKKSEVVAKIKPVKNTEAAKKAEPVEILPKVSEPAVVGEQPPAPVVEAAAVPAANVKPSLPLAVLMRRPMHFVFSEAMFAEVIDVNGEVLMSRDVPAGAEKWIGGPGRAPYQVSISIPGKAKLYYKGKEIDLSAYPPNEMAHIKVQ
jgi:cytoskeleton protein RodZ